MDFLLDSALRNELRSPSGSSGNGLKPTLRVNTLPTPSAFGWRTLCVPHMHRWRLEQQHKLRRSFSPAALQRLAWLLPIDYPLLVVQEIGARPNHIASIGGGRPDVFCQEFILGLDGPVFEFLGIPVVPTLDLLKKHDVWSKVSQMLSQLVHHQVLMELREPLVNVVGDDVELHRIRGAHDADNILSCARIAKVNPQGATDSTKYTG